MYAGDALEVLVGEVAGSDSDDEYGEPPQPLAITLPRVSSEPSGTEADLGGDDADGDDDDLDNALGANLAEAQALLQSLQSTTL